MAAVLSGQICCILSVVRTSLPLPLGLQKFTATQCVWCLALVFCGCVMKSHRALHPAKASAECSVGQWVTGWEGHAAWSSDGHVAFNRQGPNGPEWVVAAPPDYHSEISQTAEVRWSRFVTDRELAVVTQQAAGSAKRHVFQLLAIPAGSVTSSIDLGSNFTDVIDLIDNQLVVLENDEQGTDGHRSALRAYSLHDASVRSFDLSAALGDSENFFFLEQTRDGFAVLSRINAASKHQDTGLFDVALYRVDLRQLQAYPLKFEGPASSALALGTSGRFAVTPKPAAPVWVFDLRTGRHIHRLEQPVTSGEPAKPNDGSACVGFDQTGALLAVAGHEQPVRLYDLRSGKLLAASVDYAQYDQSSFFGCTITFTPDHQLVVQDDGAGGLTAWDLLSHAKRYELEFSERSPKVELSKDGAQHEIADGNRETYTEAVVSPAARHLVVFRPRDIRQQPASASSTLVDLQAGTYIKVAHGSGPAAFSQDGRLLVAGGIVWDIERQIRIGEFKTFKSSCEQ